LPTLLAASLACTLLVFILLLLHHQRARASMSRIGAPPGTPDGSPLQTIDSQQTLKPSGTAMEAQPGKPNREVSANDSLCTALVVPKGKRMVCLVEARLYQERQDIEFKITSSLSRGCKPLMLVRVSETEQSDPKIVLEQLPDGDAERGSVFASVSTTNLWEERMDSEAVFTFLDASGSVYGRFTRTAPDSYDLIAESQESDIPTLTFFGDLRDHSIRVETGSENKLVATVEPCRRSTLRASYQVSIEAGVDAGLVLLGLLTIDKSERLSPPMDSTILGPGAGTSLLFSSFLGDPAENLTELDATRD